MFELVVAPTFLGIDLGTSGLRALLLREDGDVIGAAESHYEASHPQLGWSEQDPKHWVQALETCVQNLSERYSAFRQITGIGVAGHMHGATLLDSNDQVIRPCILWNDTRSHAEAAELDRIPAFREKSGNIVFPGFTAPKLVWVKRHEPEKFARVAKVLLPAAYLNWYLTGEFVADMSDSAGTSWLDVRARAWSPELLSASHMRIDQMPRLVEGSARAGTLRPELAREWGLGPDVALAGGAGDNAAAACGTGILTQGQGFVSLGTSGVVLAARDRYAPDPVSAVHTFCHAVPERWYQMGVMLSATDGINWLSRITGKRPADLSAALGEVLQAPSREGFLPYLSGERTPHNDADIRGAFTGLGIDTEIADLTRSVMEGVAFGLRDSADALKDTGAKLDHMLAIGGGSQSSYWVKLLATVLNKPLNLPAAGEFGAALGAARLGFCAAAGADPESVMTPPKIGQTIKPDAALVEAFDEAYGKFRARYPNIKAIQ
ncbi:xylulokinase [Primorskyibacter aestuariivivens]|uniref:xylulokinase n=1 Tax=Primorskyibacter aestuariivivens TaxID=1888912 RepID=UPI002301925F|nr:xylulokinase [Primorskyibacter aestuariivivens]MDA7430640.1 xylulokinase [Primorskyibacter aestuariivivens]